MIRLRRLSWLVAVLTTLPNAYAAPAGSGLDKKVTVEVRQAPISVFLDSISQQTKVNFILADGLADEKVTAFLHDVTAEEALAVLKDIKGVDYRPLSRGGTLLLAAKDSPLLRQPPAIEGGKELDARVTIRVKGAPLDQFLSSLSGQTKVNFALADGLEDIKVTAFLEDVTAREAIETVLAVKGLSCRKIGAQTTYALEPGQTPDSR